jgi:hypothetical protein
MNELGLNVVDRLPDLSTEVACQVSGPDNHETVIASPDEIRTKQSHEKETASTFGLAVTSERNAHL